MFLSRRTQTEMSKKTSAIARVIPLAAVFALGCQTAEHNFKPPVGYVPDDVTAIKIAVAVWEPIYGKKQIADEKPRLLQARLLELL
jgi:hypothetical protein